MVTCPNCTADNPGGIDVCLRCGKHLAGSSEAPVTQVTFRNRKAIETADMSPGMAAQTPPPALPAPMVEPIVPAAGPDVTLTGSALTRKLSQFGPYADRRSDPVPAAVTVRQAAVTPAPATLIGRVGGAALAGSAGGSSVLPASAVAPNAAAPPTVVAPADAVAPPTAAPTPPKLVVVRGERINAEYPVLDGKNYVGRSADKPVDIDLDGQEPAERIWTSRQHAVVTWEGGVLVVEDLNSLNGTFVNRARIHPGQHRSLQPGDVVQIGTVQMKVVV